MHFVETLIFTEEVRDLLGEEEYRALQLALLFRPEQGALIKGSGGLRKIRWGALLGVMLAVMVTIGESPEADIFELIDASREHLESGLPL